MVLEKAMAANMTITGYVIDALKTEMGGNFNATAPLKSLWQQQRAAAFAWLSMKFPSKLDTASGG